VAAVASEIRNVGAIQWISARGPSVKSALPLPKSCNTNSHK